MEDFLKMKVSRMGENIEVRGCCFRSPTALMCWAQCLCDDHVRGLLR
jgi:hypothetical protein